jgi:hypothetical protein
MRKHGQLSFLTWGRLGVDPRDASLGRAGRAVAGYERQGAPPASSNASSELRAVATRVTMRMGHPPSTAILRRSHLTM